MSCCQAASGAELLSASVSRDAKMFSVEFSIRVDASATALRTLIDDYAALARLSPSTQSSRLIAPGVAPNTGTHPWVDVTLRPCILIFCKTLRKLSVIVVEESGVTRYESLPGLDDFNVADERLSILADVSAPQSGAILSYVASLEPGFYVPPVLGPWIVRRVVVSEMLTAATRAEKILAGGR